MRFSLPEPVFLTRFATAFLVRIFGTTASFLRAKSQIRFRSSARLVSQGLNQRNFLRFLHFYHMN